MKLPKALIKDFKNDVPIVDLCKKYGLTYFIINRRLVKMGLKKVVRGGYREGCGRKKIEKSSELQRIRDKNAKLNKSTGEGVKVRPKFKLW